MKFTSLLMALLVCCLAATPAEAADESFDSGGVKIRYVTEGEGEAVVLIHGWMADSRMWGSDPSGNTRLKGLDAFKLIALDCRGHGKSDKPHDPAQYGPEMAEDVVRLLDHLKIEKAHLIGYSSGAFIAGYVAATHPQRVLSVAYAGQAPVITEAMKPTDFAECELFADAVNEGKDLSSYIIAVTPAGRPQPTQEQAKAIAKFMFNGKDVKALAAAGRSFKDLDVTAEELKKCEAPVLFIHGGNESDHVKNRVSTVHELLGRGEVRIVEGGDHMTTLTKPEFGAALVEFLRSASSDGLPAEPGSRPATQPDEEITVPESDLARIREAAVFAETANAAGVNWDPYYLAFMKLERRKDWTDKQIKFIGMYFGAIQGFYAQSLRQRKYTDDEVWSLRAQLEKETARLNVEATTRPYRRRSE